MAKKNVIRHYLNVTLSEDGTQTKAGVVWHPEGFSELTQSVVGDVVLTQEQSDQLNAIIESTFQSFKDNLEANGAFEVVDKRNG